MFGTGESLSWIVLLYSIDIRRSSSWVELIFYFISLRRSGVRPSSFIKFESTLNSMVCTGWIFRCAFCIHNFLALVSSQSKLISRLSMMAFVYNIYPSKDAAEAESMRLDNSRVYLYFAHTCANEMNVGRCMGMRWPERQHWRDNNFYLFAMRKCFQHIPTVESRIEKRIFENDFNPVFPSCLFPAFLFSLDLCLLRRWHDGI